VAANRSSWSACAITRFLRRRALLDTPGSHTSILEYGSYLAMGAGASPEDVDRWPTILSAGGSSKAFCSGGAEAISLKLIERVEPAAQAMRLLRPVVLRRASGVDARLSPRNRGLTPRPELARAVQR